MEHERHHWIMIVNDINCAILAGMGFPYYAMKSGGYSTTIESGDLCALYRVHNNRGFVGIFEALEKSKEITTRVGARSFAMRLPWKSIAICESNQVELKSIAERLTFIKDKSHAGAYFQRSLFPINESDFELIEKAVRQNSATP